MVNVTSNDKQQKEEDSKLQKPIDNRPFDSNINVQPTNISQLGHELRQDSMTSYPNFNQPRYSTDASISNFLTLADNQPMVPLNFSQARPSIGGPILDPNQPYAPSTTLWTPQMPLQHLPSISNQRSNSQSFDFSFPGYQFNNTIRRQSETLEPFMPGRFKTPSFSSASITNQKQPINTMPVSSVTNSDLSNSVNNGINNLSNYSIATTNRNAKRPSIIFNPNEQPDIDFFNIQKRDSLTLPSKQFNFIPHTNQPTSKFIPQTSALPLHRPSNDLNLVFNQSQPKKDSIRTPPDVKELPFNKVDSSNRLSEIRNPYEVFNNTNNVVENNPNTIGNLNNVAIQSSQILPPEKTVEVPELPKSVKGKPASTKKKRKSQKANKTKKNKQLSPNKDITKSLSPNAFSVQPPLSVELTDLQQPLDDSRQLLGVTKVDQLMLMIQARKNGVTEKVNTSPNGELMLEQTSDILPPSNQLVGGVDKPKSAHGMKQHECPYCHRLFTQSTHLEVHVRSHIGYKPFQCEFCGKRFTQGGNLRTHERLHTGEKPYSCELCQKKFSRKGNLAAHALTHKKVKPFICKLDDCNKSFTQLGNMKAHQNRFHLASLKELTEKLANMDPNTILPKQEKDLLDYFASIYRNSNKGIKGRGKNISGIVQQKEAIKTKKKKKKQLKRSQANMVNIPSLKGDSSAFSSLKFTSSLSDSNLLDSMKNQPKAQSSNFQFQQNKPGSIKYELPLMPTSQIQNPVVASQNNEFEFALEDH